MASHAGLSASRFSALFRQRTGTSPLDFHIQLKMQEACRQLILSKGKIQDIATALGYDNSYYFSRLFRQVIGHSPRQYREKFQA
jgi:AraC family transcriptional regulator, arabinose operon regulatory protein